MLFSWGFLCSVFLLGVEAQFNPRPLSQRQRQTPAVVLPRNFTPRSVREAFERAAEVIRGRREGYQPRLRPENNIPVQRHRSFLASRPRSRRLETVQERFEEATRILLIEFNLTPQQIMFGLAETDLKTMLQGSEVDNCERQFNFSCRSSDRYRTYDGTCNNLKHPSWGMASCCFERLVDPEYADGTADKRLSRSGGPLPSPRRISLEIHSHFDNPTDYVTHAFMTFGQFLDHDISLSPLSQGPNNEILDCCPVSEEDPPQCDPILIDQDDPFFRNFGITCLSNVRSTICSTCSLGPRQQTNQLTAYIDASHIYALTTEEAMALRNRDGSGTLRSVNVGQVGELPPGSSIPNDDQCSFQDTEFDCFETGDQRANQHPALTSLHIISLREHNRIARRLREINPSWDDERLYQESRRIVGAELQMITYNEFLPLVLGPERMEWFDLSVRRSGYTQYDDTIPATLVNEFSTAAYRFGHSMINGFFPDTRGSDRGNMLRDMFQYPFELYRGQLDGILGGLTDSPSQKFDRNIVRDVTNHLYQTRGNQSGLDLAALNINRGRDHGIPGYTRLVEFCGGPQITNFRQLDQLFQRGVRQLFERVYESVEDIDLFSGGLAERPNQGAVVGPTFTCIIGIQFYHLKYGDRFFFEHGGQAGSFSPDQLREIRRTTLANLICQNTQIQQIQRNAFLYRGASQVCSKLAKVANISETWQP
ncbi:chorion peroxidase-like [Uloborus diversus]|uniref:chorion peroxidase-like n=1 Tax=Uloborus diversus TaxID=327109 RepID=UPI002409B839|nr:chorion peroxidase-like [Uloborus diversus]